MTLDAAGPPTGSLSGYEREAFDRATLLGGRRLRWPAERLAAWRQEKLRELLTWAVENSPFHRARFGHLDVAGFTEDDLPALPVMTKADVASEFDRVVTRAGLDLKTVSAHLDNSPGQLLSGCYRVVGTSGSTGLRGLFTYDRDEWATFAALTTRWRATELAGLAPGYSTASLFASDARHISGAMHAFFDAIVPGRGEDFVHLPASLPLPQIVARLNAAQPDVVVGYPSIIRLVAGEAEAGRLTIRPSHVSTCGEECTAEIRDAARRAWGTEIYDYWGCTEGVYAFPCRESRAMHLPDDLAIVEVVDGDNRPVAPGERGEKILLTVLFNQTQPLVRYEIGDALALVPEPCPCGCAHRRIGEVVGRSPTFFVYPGDVAVHPLGMMSVMLAAPWVSDYQVRQKPRGVEVLVVSRAEPDFPRLAAELRRALAKAGLAAPEVSVVPVESLPRLWSGKLQHFWPLPAAGAGSATAAATVGPPPSPSAFAGAKFPPYSGNRSE